MFTCTNIYVTIMHKIEFMYDSCNIGQIVPSSKSYVRDSTHLINILKDFTIQPGILLCTLDVTSLYTNIPHSEGIQSIKEMLAMHKPPDTLPHNSYIIELLELVFTNNHFEFNGEFYHQLSGTAMGTKLSPSYANLFMANLRTNMCMHILINHYYGRGS